MSYLYIKNKPPITAEKITPNRLGGTKHRTKKRWLAGVVLAVGLFLLGNAIFPIIYYQIYLSPQFTIKAGEKFALAEENTDSSIVLADDLNLVDYTKLSNWISGIDVMPDQSETTSYQISIPRLEIQSAVVNIGGNDLKKSLIQYPGTSLPGKPGNPVIFGHSTLPQFARPDNYKSIFTSLPKLKEGDDLWVNMGDVTYKYLVERLVEMGPNDLSILAQRYDDSYLTLVTCVPPGTYLKRLVVRARITKAD